MFVLEADGFPTACAAVSRRSGNPGVSTAGEGTGGAFTREILAFCPENNVSCPESSGAKAQFILQAMCQG